MKMLLSTCLAIGLLASFRATGVEPTPTSLENQVVYVNLSQLMQDSQAGKEANTVLERIRASKADEINKKAKTFESAQVELQKASAEFETKKNLLKDVKAEEKKLTELNRKKIKAEAELKETAEDAEKDFRNEYMRLSEQLFKDIRDSIVEWAKEKKVRLVLNESGQVLYSNEVADTTQHMLTVVNKKHEKVQLAKNKPVAAPAVAAPAKSA